MFKDKRTNYLCLYHILDEVNMIDEILNNSKQKGKTMKIKFKKLHPEAVEPKKATSGAAGFDMTAYSAEGVMLENNGEIVSFYRYHTGIALELPPGWCALAFPRSSIVKKNAYLGNSVGVIDSDYRGEITFCFKGDHGPYEPGDRIGQLVIIPAPDIVLEEAVELSETERGAGGYGSTGA
jgi:dUTP pyrophosphatase